MKMRMRRRGIAAVVIASLAAAATGPTASAVETGGSSDLRWHECDGKVSADLECATLTVPLDWRDPDPARTFELPVGRIKASGPRSERIGVFMYNAGGPGAPSLEYIEQIHRNLPADITRRFDFVTWNPRGTDNTTPAVTDCPFPEIEVPATGPVDWPAIASSYHDEMAQALSACFETNAEVAPYLGTWSSVRDIDALRTHLGERQINFWGMSYGSTMGRIYAQTYPNRVRTLILDGAIDPMSSTGSYAREQMWGHAMSVARMEQWFSPGVRAAHRRVMRELETRTLTTAWGAPITRYEVAMKVSELSFRQFTYEQARKTILTARDALFGSTQRQRDKAVARLAEYLEIPTPGQPKEPKTEDFVLSFVNCSDFPERIDRAEVVTVTDQAAKISGIASGSFALTESTMCVGLPVFGVPIEQRNAIRIPQPPIVVNSVADPATVLLGATKMANAFVGSRLITYDSSQHVTYTRTDASCVNDPITRYVLTRQLPKRDIACSLTPPFKR